MSKVTKTKVKTKKKQDKPVSLDDVPVPAPNDLIDVSLKIIQKEISKLSTVSATGSLDPQQARILTDYIKTLVVVDKNLKEEEATDEFKDLSDEESMR